MENKFTFWELISRYSKIEIPKLQRDYAHGRDDYNAKEIINKLLDDIKNAIETEKELNLNFIYGREENHTFIPVDGQQRLTTLFLLHWYIALKEGKLNNTVKEILTRFTYEVRLSSQDFCYSLVKEAISYDKEAESISNLIRDTNWFSLSWLFDLTVSSMLNVLDKIHQRFKNIKTEVFEKLIKKKIITFHFLSLDKLSLTDELYIKMNARGKPLTEFENFKANFSSFLPSIEEKAKLDNEWLDIFWKLELKENKNTQAPAESVDRKFFNFFKNVTLNFFVEANKIDTNFMNKYNLFEIYKEVYSNKENVEKVVKILDALTIYNDDDSIFYNFLSDSLTYGDRVKFYSLSLFFIKYGAPADSKILKIFKRWKRVTKNLIENTRIDEVKDFVEAISSIKFLSLHIDDIYNFLISSSDKIKFFYRAQVEEEKLKAELILNDNEWEKLFVDIEEHPYFNGQIGFILNYSKIENEYDKSLFKEYSIKLKELFSDKFKEKYNFLFQRALLTKGDYLVDIGSNKTFCVFDSALRTKMENWRKVFNDEKKTLILKSLLDEVDKDNIKQSLENIIKKYKSKIDKWRQLIVENPNLIEYCKRRQVRWLSYNKIYLLSKTQMNSYHRELFSYVLYKKLKDDNFLPSSVIIWYNESITWDEPFIEISPVKYNEKHNLKIHITHLKDEEYSIEIYSQSGKKLPKKIKEILKNLGFEEEYSYWLGEGLRIIVKENEVKQNLINLFKIFEFKR